MEMNLRKKVERRVEALDLMMMEGRGRTSPQDREGKGGSVRRRWWKKRSTRS